MVKLVTTIHRVVGGVKYAPGDEFEVDDRSGAEAVRGGGATPLPEKPKPETPPPAATAKPTAAATSAKGAEPAKASSEVKPLTLAQGPNPPGEYGTRDLKAKE
jgi:hypothetical protein